jgi:glutamate formiminotransferase
MALEIPDKKQIQISIMFDDKRTPIHKVFETIKSEAKQYGIFVESTELVGGTPSYAIEDVVRFYLQAHTFSIKDIS